MEPTDSELLDRVCRDDDREAFRVLVLRHQGAVRSFLRSLTPWDSALADDLAQDTFVTAHASLDRFERSGRLLTWLLGIARNHARNEGRSHRRRRRLLGQPPESRPGSCDRPPSYAAAPLVTGAQGQAATRTTDLRMDLDEALNHLGADERMALHLAYTQGLSHEEVARAAGWPLGTAKTHISRARDKLRPYLTTWNPTT